jgi:hypothetical protein
VRNPTLFLKCTPNKREGWGCFPLLEFNNIPQMRGKGWVFPTAGIQQYSLNVPTIRGYVLPNVENSTTSPICKSK